MYYPIAFLFAMFMVAGPLSPAGAEEIKEGSWALTIQTTIGLDSSQQAQLAAVKTQVNQMPEGAQFAFSNFMNDIENDGQGGIYAEVKQCLTNQQPVPKLPDSEGCQETHEIKGNVVNYHSVCDFAGTKTETAGELTFAGDTMAGKGKQQRTRGFKVDDITVKIEGKYLGPCEK